MEWTRILRGCFSLLAPLGLWACAHGQPTALESGSEPTAGAETAQAAGKGTLIIRANGEDFVRQGFTSKDGWAITFDHVYVSLADITASQADPPFNPEAGGKLEAKAQVIVPDPVVVDLAAGNATAEPILVAEVDAPAGHFNALSWRMVPAQAGPSQGYSLWIQGTATKDGQSLPFTLKVDEELAFTCGEFVGDERKGILDAGDMADLEATFHFDHLFGDADTPADDALNTGALGFGPLAALAQNGAVNGDLATLKAGLSEADYATFIGILPSLGHVGEGHCEEVKLTS
ncbi:MAG TPA: DUF4382 domain-containing protein [Leptolyngbyaceae cyanobacterium M65_K2018_010]|nr:DUF4382 domain-containing protein [Leptolyngbyaceae cyanobacterium M65_K2018_010]